MARRSVLKTSRSIRTLRKVNTRTKRYNFKKISSTQDLRTFFYEYSLFVGDVMSFPGLPQFSTVNNIRHNLLVAGRVMGDVQSVLGTIQKFQMGDTSVEGAGERIFRRAGGRLTGKVLMAIPGQNVFARSARSVIGGNMQRAFDKKTKDLFRKSIPDKAVVNVVGGFDAQIVANSIEDAVGMVMDDVQRQSYPFIPVRTGRLRGTLRARMTRERAIGGKMPAGEVLLGDDSTKDYHTIIEFGSGKGFNVGAQHLERYFPTPESVKALKNSSKNRRAVNSTTKKGAPMRRGARNTVERINRSYGNVRVTPINLVAQVKKLRS